MLIENANLLQMCHDCGAVGFLPKMTYTYDAEAETVTVVNDSDIPGGDGISVFKGKVHDFFGNDVAEGNDDGGNLVFDVSDLNRSKALALTVTIKTDNGIIADGGAYGLLAAGDVAHWDVQMVAQA